MTDHVRIVTVSRVIPADAAVIFDLLARPSRHHELDGSDTVRGAQVDAPDRLSLGARFRMRMRRGPVPYGVVNTVIEFDEGRRIAWRHVGGQIWRYMLEPTDGGTLVTEQFDWGASKAPTVLRLLGYPEKNRVAMEATLDRIAAITTPSS